MFDTIVVGIDGRPQDEEAIALARLLAAPGARIVLATIARVRDGFLRPGLPEETAAPLEEAQATVDAAVLRHPGTEGIAVASPAVARGLSRVAHAERAQLVVVASSRRGLIGRACFGDDIRQIVEQVPAAVAVAAKGHLDRSIGRVVVGYDGSEESEAAIRIAVAVGRQHGASVEAIQVVEPSVPISPLPGVFVGNTLAEDLEAAQANVTRLSKTYELEGSVALGRASRELAARASEADLLVIGFQDDRGMIDRLLIGGTAHALLLEQTTPTVVVPSDRGQGRGTAAA